MFDSEPPEDLVMRPSRSPAAPERCPWGCDLSVAGVSAGYSHWYGAGTFTCLACGGVGGPEAGQWLAINVAVAHQKHPDEVNTLKISLVVLPPEVPAGLGQIQLAHQSTVLGYVALSLCPSGCGRAVVSHLEVAVDRRRRGVGLVLAEAVRARCERFAVTTAPWPPDPVTTRFWARAGLLGPPEPRPCRHQLAAGIAGEGWEVEAYRANQL